MKYKVTVLFQGFPAVLGLGTWALIQDEEHNILFDTGNGYVRPFLKSLLSEYNIQCEDIDTVILSHLHWDHTFNMDFFPHARYIFRKDEWISANQLDPRDILVDRAALTQLRTSDTRLITLDGEEIFPGMHALFTPGHTPGGLSIVLDQDDEKWVLTGDAIKTRGELRTGDAGMTYNPEITRETIRKVKSIADRVLLGHDGWVRIEGDKIIPEENTLILKFGQGVTANGGKNQVAIRLDD